MTTPEVPKDSTNVNRQYYPAYYGSSFIRPEDSIPCVFNSSLGPDLALGLMSPDQIFGCSGGGDYVRSTGMGEWTSTTAGGWGYNYTGMCLWEGDSTNNYTGLTYWAGASTSNYTGFVSSQTPTSDNTGSYSGVTGGTNGNATGGATISTSNNNVLEQNGYKATINADGTITYKDSSGKTVPSYQVPETLVANANAEAAKRKA